MKTNRGFELQYFEDDYGAKCSIQESSSIVPHIWLGVHDPDVNIQWKDAVAAGLDVVKDDPDTNECGWCTLQLPGREMDCEGKEYSPAIVRRDLCKNCFKMLCAVTKMYFADCVDAPGGEYSELPKSKGDTE